MRSRILATLALLALSLAACDIIVGLDKFKHCDTCGSDASGDAEVDASDGAPSDAFVLPDGLSEASSWPHWRMPNVPVEVQAGASDASLASFTVSGGLVHDNVTGNTWNAQLGTATTFDDAAAYCTKLQARLPTRIEAATLLDSTRAQLPYTHPALDAIFVPDGASPPNALWTSSYNRPVTSPLHFWFASLQSGDMITSLPVQGLGVLCIQ